MQKSEGTRVDILLKALNISQLDFANSLGVTSGAIGNWKKRELGINVINKIIKTYPQVRFEWLINGEGEPLISTNSVAETLKSIEGDNDCINDIINIKVHPTHSHNTRVGVPYYNVDFSMGYDLMVNDQTTNPDYMINFQPYNLCDAWCNARGDSMSPTISSGDIIALKKIEDFHFLISGEIYAIVTVNDLRTIKRVKDNGDSLTLVPDNKDYPEQVISKNDVRYVFQVMGSMKKF